MNLDAPALPRRTASLRWWRELAYVAAFYVVYSLIRSRISAGREVAAANAQRIIEIERAMGLYVERAVQQAFIDTEWFIVFWNVFYGSLHFVVTIGVLVWLYRTAPGRYRFWRTVLAIGTALALVGYAVFPLMPPRFLPGYVDTLADRSGLWSFGSGPMKDIANPYAAMPSLHFGWSLWCALAVATTTARRWVRAVISLYPVATLFAIVVTANHFWLDAAGGAAVIAVALPLARALALPHLPPSSGGVGIGR